MSVLNHGISFECECGWKHQLLFRRLHTWVGKSCPTPTCRLEVMNGIAYLKVMRFVITNEAERFLLYVALFGHITFRDPCVHVIVRSRKG